MSSFFSSMEPVRIFKNADGHPVMGYVLETAPTEGSGDDEHFTSMQVAMTELLENYSHVPLDGEEILPRVYCC